MLQESLEVFESPDLSWSTQPDPAELAALEDIQREGWFDLDEPVIVSLLELVEAVSSVSDTENEVLATVAHMLESESVVLLNGRTDHSLPLGRTQAAKASGASLQSELFTPEFLKSDPLCSDRAPQWVL